MVARKITNEKILQTIQNNNNQATIWEISTLTGIKYHTLNARIKKLEKQGHITNKQIGYNRKAYQTIEIVNG